MNRWMQRDEEPQTERLETWDLYLGLCPDSLHQVIRYSGCSVLLICKRKGRATIRASWATGKCRVVNLAWIYETPG